MALVDSEQRRLQKDCHRTERHLDEPDGTIPEEGEGAFLSQSSHPLSSHLTFLLRLNWVRCEATQFAVAATNIKRQ